MHGHVRANANTTACWGFGRLSRLGCSAAHVLQCAGCMAITLSKVPLDGLIRTLITNCSHVCGQLRSGRQGKEAFPSIHLLGPCSNARFYFFDSHNIVDEATAGDLALIAVPYAFT